MAFDAKEYYRKNKQKINEYNRLYHQNNKDKIFIRRQLQTHRKSIHFTEVIVTKGPIRVEL
jgi:DNA-directed RNA polymerase beta' subunit